MTITLTSGPMPLPSGDADPDFEKLYDRISLQLYWNAKVRYLKAKRAFFGGTVA